MCPAPPRLPPSRVFVIAGRRSVDVQAHQSLAETLQARRPPTPPPLLTRGCNPTYPACNPASPACNPCTQPATLHTQPATPCRACPLQVRQRRFGLANPRAYLQERRRRVSKSAGKAMEQLLRLQPYVSSLQPVHPRRAHGGADAASSGERRGGLATRNWDILPSGATAWSDGWLGGIAAGTQLSTSASAPPCAGSLTLTYGFTLLVSTRGFTCRCSRTTPRTTGLSEPLKC